MSVDARHTRRPSPLLRLLAIVLTFCIIGPPIHAALYAFAYVTSHIGSGDTVTLATDTLVREIYEFGTIPAIAVALLLGLLLICRSSVTWTSALLIGFVIGAANITYLFLADPPREPRTISVAGIVTMHALTWAVAAAIFRAILAPLTALIDRVQGKAA